MFFITFIKIYNQIGFTENVSDTRLVSVIIGDQCLKDKYVKLCDI